MKLTANDIVSIAQSGEGYNAEFKVSLPSKIKELAGEVCAFANAAGGVLLLGINDQNQVVEQVGSGIGRIEKILKNAGQPKPIYKTDGLFTVIFSRTQKTTQKTAQKIMDAIAQDPGISRRKLAELIGGITENGIKYNLNKLKNEGVIKRIGPDKGYWEITKG